MRKPIILGVEGFAADLVAQAEAGICIQPENEDELLEAVEKLARRPAARPLARRGGLRADREPLYLRPPRGRVLGPARAMAGREAWR